MPQFATVEVYEAIAATLNADEEWRRLAAGIDLSIVYVYSEPVDKAFHVRFSGGQVSDVREVADPAAEGSDYVLTARPEVWRRVFQKVPKARASGFHLALSTGQIRFNGPFMQTYLKHTKAWEHMLDQVTLQGLVTD